MTGARGFLGSHLVEDLRRDMQVGPFDGDVRDPAAYEGLPKADLVFHLAAISSIPRSVEDPVLTWEVNSGGTLQLLEWARTSGARRVVLVSTGHVYGRPQYSPIDEDHPLAPVSPYGASKLSAELAARTYESTYGLEVVIVRPFNVYGPRQAPGFLVPDVFHPMARGEAPVLGDPEPVRDFTFVSDAVRFLRLAGTLPQARGATLNLGSGIGYSVRELAYTAAAVSGTDLQPTFSEARARKGETTELVVDNARAASILGWKPEVGLREGLRLTWDAMKDGA